jgi:hypothetical protein
MPRADASHIYTFRVLAVVFRSARLGMKPVRTGESRRLPGVDM